jgi:lysophospholipase L1-like esterase
MPLSPQPRPIIAFGDSLVEGLGASKNQDWVSLLAARYHIPILNKGRRHDTTRSALIRLEEDVIYHNPYLTILLLGGNDILFRIPKKETFLNLSKIIDRIQEQEISVLLVGVRGGILMDAFAGKFQTLAEEKGIPFIPNILEDILEDPGLMTDPLHPNDEGHQIIADRIESMLGQGNNPTSRR